MRPGIHIRLGHCMVMRNLLEFAVMVDVATAVADVDHMQGRPVHDGDGQCGPHAPLVSIPLRFVMNAALAAFERRDQIGK